MSRLSSIKNADNDEEEFSLDEDNVYVQELKKVFDSCDATGTGLLDQNDLHRLCDHLQLSDHTQVIISHLLPIEEDGLQATDVDFKSFKSRFVQVLPDIVEMNAPASSINVANPGRSTNVDDQSPGTSNDNRTDAEDMSDDVGVNSQPSKRSKTSVARAELYRNVESLALAENGYLDRYETRLLCQHMPGLSGLSIDDANRLFRMADTDLDGRITVAQFERSFLRSPKARQLMTASSTPPESSLYDGSATNPDIWSIGEQARRSSLSPSLGAKRAAIKSARFNGQLNSFGGTGALDLHLFTQIDAKLTGTISLSDLLTYWDNIGVTNGAALLKKLDMSSSWQLSALTLSRALTYALTDATVDNQLLTAAWLSVQHELSAQKQLSDELRKKAGFYEKEFQQMNNRQNLLIDELDQSQTNIEKSTENKLRDLESEHRHQLDELTARYRNEKDFLTSQLNQLDEQLKQSRQRETDAKQRNTQINKENGRLKKEAVEQAQCIKEVESLNRELRAELQRATALARRAMKANMNVSMGNKSMTLNSENVAVGQSSTKNDTSAATIVGGASNPVAANDSIWKHRAELLSSQNKRLKDKLDELVTSSHPNKIGVASTSRGNGLTSRGIAGTRTSSNHIINGHQRTHRVRPFVAPSQPTADFKRQLSQLKARRQKMKRTADSLSEMESDVEPWIIRARHRRRLNKRQRRAKSESRLNRALTYFESHPEAWPKASLSPSQSDAENIPPGVPVFNEHLIERSSEPTVKSSRVSASTSGNSKTMLNNTNADGNTLEKEGRAILARLEKEKAAIRSQCQSELEMLLDSAKKQREEALRLQHEQLTKRYEQEKHELAVKFASEQNQLERTFAEEKMEMMSHLQQDFETELKRAREQFASERANTITRQSSKEVEEREKKIKTLEESLEGQRNGYMSRIQALDIEKQKLIDEMETYRNDVLTWSTLEQLPQPARMHIEQIITQQLKDAVEATKREQEELGRVQMDEWMIKQQQEHDSALHDLNDQLVLSRQECEQMAERLDHVLLDVQDMQEKCDQLADCEVALQSASARCIELENELAEARNELEVGRVSPRNAVVQTDMCTVMEQGVQVGSYNPVPQCTQTENLLTCDTSTLATINCESSSTQTDVSQPASLLCVACQTERNQSINALTQTDTTAASIDFARDGSRPSSHVETSDSGIQTDSQSDEAISSIKVNTSKSVMTVSHPVVSEWVQTDPMSYRAMRSPVLAISAQRDQAAQTFVHSQVSTGMQTGHQLLDEPMHVSPGPSPPHQVASSTETSPKRAKFGGSTGRLPGPPSDARLMVTCARCDTVTQQLSRLYELMAQDLPEENSNLNAARQKLRDLRVQLTVADSQLVRQQVAAAKHRPIASPRTPPSVRSSARSQASPPNTAKVSSRSRSNMSTGGTTIEELREENYLLNVRLNETRSLLNDTVMAYQKQMQETSRLGRMLRSAMTSTTNHGPPAS